MLGLAVMIALVGCGYMWLAQASRQTTNNRRSKRQQSWRDWIKDDD